MAETWQTAYTPACPVPYITEIRYRSIATHVSPLTAGSDETVKVPQMAESISEGTLKTWNKKVGDRVEQDEDELEVRCPGRWVK